MISHDTSLLEAEKLKQFDAVYLNNTVGVSADVFRPELREAFAAFIRNGGGLVANHGSSVASPNWDEYTEILGATGAAHRAADEKIMVKLDDPSHPLNAPFAGKGFEFTDEIFRFKPPSPRRRVHVLFSIDVPKTDMNQGRCTSSCESEDGAVPAELGAELRQGPRVLFRAGAQCQCLLGRAYSGAVSGRYPIRAGRPGGRYYSDVRPDDYRAGWAA